jgi:hypothetical protein
MDCRLLGSTNSPGGGGGRAQTRTAPVFGVRDTTQEKSAARLGLMLRPGGPKQGSGPANSFCDMRLDARFSRFGPVADPLRCAETGKSAPSCIHYRGVL